MTAAEIAEKIENLQREAAAARNRARYEADPEKKAEELKSADALEAQSKSLAQPPTLN